MNQNDEEINSTKVKSINTTSNKSIYSLGLNGRGQTKYPSRLFKRYLVHKVSYAISTWAAFPFILDIF